MLTTKDFDSISDQDKAYMLALSVIGARIRELCPDDRDDLFEITKEYLTTTDDEAKRSAAKAMFEIIEQPKPSVRTTRLASGIPAEWISYISARIRDFRKKADLSQEELAEKSGLTQSHISRLENGEHSPTGLTLEKIARALGIEPSQLDPSARE